LHISHFDLLIISLKGNNKPIHYVITAREIKKVIS
jgi:hypothetical protein